MLHGSSLSDTVSVHLLRDLDNSEFIWKTVSTPEDPGHFNWKMVSAQKKLHLLDRNERLDDMLF